MKIITKGFVRRLGFVVLFISGLLVISTLTFHFIEGWSYIDAFYFSVVTITTVGYGDLSPTSDLAKLLTSGLILLSIPILFFVIGVAADSIFTNFKRESDREERRKERIRSAARKKRRDRNEK
jgi:voltage-gated potassium channel